MSFVSIGGGEDVLQPTFFELISAERLTPSLKAAVVYSLWVYAQRHPWVRKLLEYEDEVYFVGSSMLEWHSINTCAASLAESVFGMKRQSTSGLAKGGALKRKQILLSLAFLVLVPYLKQKMGKAYLGSQVPQASTTSSSPQQVPVSTGTRQKIVNILRTVYPWLHLTFEGSELIYQLLYLVGKTLYFSPWLQLMGLRLVRVSGNDLAEQARVKGLKRWQAIHSARNQGNAVFAKVKEALLRTSFLLSDHGQHLIVTSVFLFKAFEWWFTTGEEKLQESKALPVPPCPPPPTPHPAGTPLPFDSTLCPLCRWEIRSHAGFIVPLQPLKRMHAARSLSNQHLWTRFVDFSSKDRRNTGVQTCVKILKTCIP